MFVAAQVSIYPLRQARLSPAIDRAQAALRAHGLTVQPGPMSTVVSGEDDAVFGALANAFREAALEAETLMTVTVSNACPVPEVG